MLLRVCLRFFSWLSKLIGAAIHYLIGFGRVDGSQSLFQIFVVHWIGFNRYHGCTDRQTKLNSTSKGSGSVTPLGMSSLP